MGGTVPVTEEGGGGTSGASSGVGRAKKRMLVGDVSEYWGIYEGEGSD